jgi:Fe-S cluster assembly protein SufD
VTPSAAFTAPGGDVEMLGIYFADAGQHLEHRLFVDHACRTAAATSPTRARCRARRAHGLDRRRADPAGAEGTDTYELNRNLVLTDGARADSVPNLEIETGEIIGAGHASATGRFDDEQLFYLQSAASRGRGARMVVRGFFAELVHRIGVPRSRSGCSPRSRTS